MAGRSRMQVGSGPWITEERSSATQIVESEVEEFAFSVQNDMDWLNEHMAEVFSENQINVAEIFKTPGKLRGKTPRTMRKADVGESRVPLSNIFSSTPKGGPNPFAIANHSRANTPRVKIAADHEPTSPTTVAPTSPLKQLASSKPIAPPKSVSLVDSGYHGSQSLNGMEIDDALVLGEETQPFSPQPNTDADHDAFQSSPLRESPAGTAHPSSDPAQETAEGNLSTQGFTTHVDAEVSPAKDFNPETTTPTGSPSVALFTDAGRGLTPEESLERSHTPSAEPPEVDPDATEMALGSPSEGSSPIRPIVRKSSLNFASLPAREPITHKSIGNRISRTSHLEQNRTSYYRHTGGKSLGHAPPDVTDDENDGNDENDEMEVDEFPAPSKPQNETGADDAAVHNKTYTQRLQDQINKLGKSQPSTQQNLKTAPDSGASQSSLVADALPLPTPSKLMSSKKTALTPGTFPEDDDDWIEPLGTPDDASNFKSPLPPISKSYTADIMEGVTGKSAVSDHDFTITAQTQYAGRSQSPHPSPEQERITVGLGHHKSVSVPVLPMASQPCEDEDDNDNELKKTISAITLPLPAVSESRLPASPKSPSRGFSNSPLKQVKNKLSSILKSSKGLLASSAAISAEGKSSLISPSTARLGLLPAPSMETLRSPVVHESQPLYPDLSRQVFEAQKPTVVASPERNGGRRTRASIEREKAEERRKKEEAKEAKRQAEQADKLEKAREKEREKARIISKEQERVAAMEKQVASQREQDKRSAIATPGNISRTIKNSPRKIQQQISSDDLDMDLSETEEGNVDVDMADVLNTMPPPSVSRLVAPSSAMKAREIKRPIKPIKELPSKMKQAPTVIRVNMGSQQTQYQPSNSTLSSTLHETLSQPQLKSKSSQPSLQDAKRSIQSLKSSTSSSGRPKALEAAARRKEQEEREAQRRREVKAELDRKRIAMQEEERRQEQQRKNEVEQQREEERKQAAIQAEAKKNAQRQAMLEKAKQTRAPPPAIRNQPNGPPEYSRNEPGPPRPPSRLGSIAPRSQEDAGRPVNASKAQMKRPLTQETADDNMSRAGQTRNANGLQPKESKRMRMTDELDDVVENGKQPSLKGAPVRPSGGFKKDLPTKSMFPAGYTNAPPQSVTRDLFKATVTSQHNGHLKTAHPLDMAQVSKGTIPFAPNPSKTPARPIGLAATKSTAKSATRSSPRFQNGDSIELPEINTDDEDEDEDEGDAGKGLVADWADSPNLRRALVEQENRNPFEVFGAPAPLNMEEVFARSKERFPKFRARTSSANWSGPDGLTEEDIRKDLAAREKMRREGGWSYDMGREMI